MSTFNGYLSKPLRSLTVSFGPVSFWQQKLATLVFCKSDWQHEDSAIKSPFESSQSPLQTAPLSSHFPPRPMYNALPHHAMICTHNGTFHCSCKAGKSHTMHCHAKSNMFNILLPILECFSYSLSYFQLFSAE